MYLDILNSENSKTGVETEANLIRAALLMSDKITVAGKCSFFLYLKEYLDKTDLEHKKELLIDNVKSLYKKHPKLVNYYCRTIDLYTSMMKKKSKSNDATLAMMKLKPYLDHFQNDIIEYYNKIAGAYKITDLVRFADCERNNITIFVKSDTSSKANIFLIKTITKNIDDILILDSNVFGMASYKELNDHDDEFVGFFQNTSDPIFVWKPMLKMKVLRNLDYEHLKTIRNNYISVTEPFRNELLHVSETLRKIFFSEENIQALKEHCDNVCRLAVEFEKVEIENALIENLIKAGTESKQLKINFAVTSLDNMIRMLERIGIITEKERMYSCWELSQNINLSMSVPFLIAEEE